MLIFLYNANGSLSRIVQLRQLRPWLRPDWLFNLFPYASEQQQGLSILHGFTDQVIYLT